MPNLGPTRRSIDDTVVAAIDIGTNSFHLLVAKIDETSHIKVLDTHKESVRFGEALAETGEISEEKIAQGIAALKVMKHIAEPYNPVYRVIATQATRAATNYDRILSKIHLETNLHVEIIDGLEEARLTYLGMRFCHDLGDAVTLGLDIGGGSTEVAIGRGDKSYFMTSLKLGALTSTKRFFGNKQYNKKAIEKLKSHILTRIAPLTQEAESYHVTRAYATSGTAKAMARLHYLESAGEEIAEPNGYQFAGDDLKLIEKRLSQLVEPELIKDYYQIDSKRSEIILAGALIFKSISDLFKVEEWTISTYGIREGIVLDTLQRLNFRVESFHFNQQWRSINGFAKKLRIDIHFAKLIQAQSRLIFDELVETLPSSLLPKGIANYRSLLESAAYLNEAGKFLAFNSYHKHSYYLIANSNLLGFSREEKHIIALINRFSRKKTAEEHHHKSYPYLRGRIEIVNFLGGCIRASRSIYRSRIAKISKVSIEYSKGSLQFGFCHPKSIDIEAERHAFRKEQKALGRSWHLTVDLKVNAE